MGFWLAFDVWITILLHDVLFWLIVKYCEVLADVLLPDLDACTMFVCTKLASSWFKQVQSASFAPEKKTTASPGHMLHKALSIQEAS